MRRKVKNWMKWFVVTLGSLLVILIILGFVFSQLTLRLVMGLGYLDVYNGNNERGNAIMNYAISKLDTIDADIYHSLSVQNTKNGNYSISIPALEKTMEMSPEEASGYYGWVLLYYYKDYERALKILEIHDAFSPDFQDAPMGEDIHYLKGLAQMQLHNYEVAIREFDEYINLVDSTSGEAFVDVYAFVQKGRCLANLEQFDKAVLSYKRAIKNYDNCTEAYYFMGITQMEMLQTEKACENFNIAHELIKQGFKSSDNYVEYFHEVYQLQIEESIRENCLNSGQ